MTQKTIGRYEIRSELGKGGMGAVYLAYDPVLEREVALKLLPSYFAQDPEFSSRFAREAKTVAGLDHQAIVAVYDFGEDDVWPYFVMRYMRGGSLKERLAKGPVPLVEANHIVQRIAGALDKAHGNGIVHRDLKPGNILYDGEGQPYLGDFGIVRLAESSENFTRTGSTLGTPAYMSPEQADTLPDIDGRSDVYSLGVVLYEMLSGETPYQHDSMPRLLMMHLTAPIPNLIQARPDLPQALQDIINKAMAKDRAQRYQSAGEMAAALQAVITAAARPAAPPKPAPAPQPAPAPKPAAEQAPAVTQSPAATPQPAAQQPSPSATPPQTAPDQVTPQPAATAPSASGANRKWLFAGAAMVALIITIILAAVVVRAFIDREPEVVTEKQETPIEEPTEAPVEEPTEASIDEPTVAPIDEPDESTLAGLPDLEERRVSIAVENAYLPFNYIDPETGEPAGWDYDVWNDICRLLNCTPDFVATAWEDLIQRVAQGDFDVGADGITLTEERSQVVDFSTPYLSIDQRILVRADEDRFSTVDAVQADSSLAIGAQAGTTNEAVATDTFGQERVTAYETFPMAVRALLTGELDVVITEEIAGLGYQGVNGGRLKFVGQPLNRESLGFIFPKGSDLVEPVNKALALLEENGRLQAWAEQYFTDQFTITYDDLSQ